ncbi:MAG: hypothetical protein LQ340_003701 [Diploschistes diacapsis]|nr:MAG: hypothetical protein LQ340_003701 [Diploschistes diacapsis]
MPGGVSVRDVDAQKACFENASSLDTLLTFSAVREQLRRFPQASGQVDTVKQVLPRYLPPSQSSSHPTHPAPLIPLTAKNNRTSHAKELPPQSIDWFYTRAAAVARHVYLRKTVGVGRLRKVHGSAKNRGSRPSHHVNASGSVDRKVMQALEKIGVLEHDEEKGGRRITQSGQRDLDRIAQTTLEEDEEDDEDDE